MSEHYLGPDPDAADLAAIEAEWPLIEAEMDLVVAECRLALDPTDTLAIHAYRRAQRAAHAAAGQFASRHEPPRREASPLALVPTTPPTATGTAPAAA